MAAKDSSPHDQVSHQDLQDEIWKWWNFRLDSEGGRERVTIVAWRSITATKAVAHYTNLHLLMEKGMATHSNVLAWRIPWTEKPGGLQPIGLQRFEHDWSNLAHTRWCQSSGSWNTSSYPCLGASPPQLLLRVPGSLVLPSLVLGHTSSHSILGLGSDKGLGWWPLQMCPHWA